MIQKHHGIFKHYYLNHIYDDINDSNLNKNRKILIMFHDMIANMNTNNKFQSTVKELFIRCKKLNIYLVFITILFSCSRRCQIELYTLCNKEDS